MDPITLRWARRDGDGVGGQLPIAAGWALSSLLRGRRARHVAGDERGDRPGSSRRWPDATIPWSASANG